MKIQIKLYATNGQKLLHVEYKLKPGTTEDQAEELLAELAVKINTSGLQGEWP